MDITLTLPPPIVQLVLQSLGAQPYAQVAQAVQLITTQAQQQIAQAAAGEKAGQTAAPAPAAAAPANRAQRRTRR